MTFEFIQATGSDKGYLLALRKRTMHEHLEKSGQFLSASEHAERLNHRYENSSLIFHREELIGAVKYRSTTNTVELFQLQIDPKHQNKGFGTGIVKQILSKETNKTVKLSVLKDSPALTLYKRLGFQIVGDDRYEFHMQNTPP